MEHARWVVEHLAQCNAVIVYLEINYQNFRTNFFVGVIYLIVCPLRYRLRTVTDSRTNQGLRSHIACTYIQ